MSEPITSRVTIHPSWFLLKSSKYLVHCSRGISLVCIFHLLGKTGTRVQEKKIGVARRHLRRNVKRARVAVRSAERNSAASNALRVTGERVSAVLSRRDLSFNRPAPRSPPRRRLSLNVFLTCGNQQPNTSGL